MILDNFKLEKEDFLVTNKDLKRYFKIRTKIIEGDFITDEEYEEYLIAVPKH